MASPFLSSPTPHHRAGHTHSGSKQRPTFEVADILRAHLPDSLRQNGDRPRLIRQANKSPN
ncbi:MAG: hypothetical protein N838_25810 [Thiohalocapsa sp. PB-PSB1]|nr:MAG: hypothetical protein N838_25810 [Thiohalocapsa sp. PB-PSB1]